MRRGGPLKRTSPLVAHKRLEARTELPRSEFKRNAPMPRGNGLARTAPMPASRTGGRSDAEAKAWTALRKVRYELSEGRCDYCGNALAFDEYECHHRMLTAHAGPDELVNTVALHAMGCHVPLVHGGGQRSYDNGFLVHRWDSPAEVPVLRHGRDLVYPTAEGWVSA